MNKAITVDEAAAALFAMMQSDFKQEWRSRLSSVPGLDAVRAEDELMLLDYFAAYFSLKFTRSPTWRAKGQLVFEKLFSLFAHWLARFWEGKNAGTVDDAVRILGERLAAYGAVIEEPASADPQQLIQSIGLRYAMFAFTDDSFVGTDGRPRADRFPEFVARMSQDTGEVAIAVGSEVFNHRMQKLHAWFDSHSVV